jgi:FADH2-dependent halogenase
MKSDMETDVVILGGGPAGATAAACLAKKGHRVTVLEKDIFPRFHIGESLLPYNTRLFDELGLTEKIRSQNFVVKQGAQFWLGNGKQRVQIVFSEGVYNEETTALQVERAQFDQLLLEHAREAGATAKEGCTVTSFAVEPDHVAVNYSDAQGNPAELRAKFLLDATGQAAFTGVRQGLKEAYKNHRKIAIFGHFSGVSMPPEPRNGDIIVVRLQDGWFWLIPLSAEKTSVGFVMDSARFKAAKCRPEDMFAEVVRNTPAVQDRMKTAALMGEFHVLADFSYRNRSFVSPRLMRIGDAAGFLDPIFSSGVYLAMTSARDAAKEADHALRTGKSLTPGMRRYEKELHREMDLYWKLIQNYYSEPFIDLFMADNPPLQLRSAVNSILAGRLRQNWSIRWRLWVFYLCVRFQKRFSIVPRTAWH